MVLLHEHSTAQNAYAQFSPHASLLAFQAFLHTTVTLRLALLFHVPPSCPALPFEGFNFILTPSLAVRHLSFLLPSPPDPIGSFSPVPPLRLTHILGSF